MKKILFIFFICALQSCTDFDDEAIEISGEFTHLSDNCGADTETESEESTTETETETDTEVEEVSCTEIVTFIDETTAEILIDGSDTAQIVNYAIYGKNIIFTDDEGIEIELSFTIVSETSIIRHEDSETWEKTEEEEGEDTVDEEG
ncbi:hypothetical protein KO500_15785 [Cellulophaga baltica]|uniref:hypothetical protein n=1 Tax=Cellulophaga TaxID=104264 RepID=UPI001C071437|nr:MULTISPECIES: hypothetical protein [Cellulophaga]MBU2997903.1 hypothetical protein [Cellulophaga baltica]MDO6769304.1 hypothetical protein [Cellulophaga sp. 1_MG-2023]